jgi:uncharacterized protein GlcG (DUF336 family)
MNLDQALAVIDRARKASDSIGIPVSVSVVDAGGNIVAMMRFDGASFITPAIATSKACTAAAGGVSTAALAEALPDSASLVAAAAVATGGKFILAGGGAPVVSASELIGGVGVSGGSGDQDAAIAQAAADLS